MTRAGQLLTALGAVVVVAGVALLVFGLPGHKDPSRYSALFSSSRGLVAGNDVRVEGAIAGRVKAVRLRRDGRAEVDFDVDDAVGTVRTDAAAAIRPVDLLGDTYLALSPGSAAAPLRGPISTERTSTAPRLDELLRSFTPAVRDGMQSLLVEGGLALDRRGADLSRAAVALRPTLEAGDRVVQELDAQDGALANLVTRADRTLRRLDAHRGDIGPILDDLATTLRTTAGRRDDLDIGLAGLPGTLARVRSTATRLDATATAATPLAAQLRDVAPRLTTTLDGLEPLLTRVRADAPGLTSGVDAARGLLVDGSDGFGAVTQGLRDATTAAPDTDKLLDALVPAFPKISQGFLVNFPDQAAEPGKQPFDPFADDRRAYWRGAAVFSCEAFGIPVAPGCLNTVITGGAAPKAKEKTAAKKDGAPAGTNAPDAPATTKPSSPSLPATPELPDVKDVVPKVTQALSGVLGGTLPAVPTTPPSGSSDDDLLDFLLG